MIEVIMYMAIGFLFGGLVALAVIPLVHNRAVRLTMRRLETAVPLSVAETIAEQDLLRAEFAMSTRRLQLELEKFRDQNAKLHVLAGKKSDLANRLMAGRSAMQAETLDLRRRVATLEKQVSGVDRGRPAKAHIVREMVPRRLVS